MDWTVERTWHLKMILEKIKIKKEYKKIKMKVIQIFYKANLCQKHGFEEFI